MSHFNLIYVYNVLQYMPMRKEMIASTKVHPPSSSVAATSRDHGEGMHGRKGMSMTKSKAKSRRPRRIKDGIDLERVIWDPEYRTAVRERLNRLTTLRQLPQGKRA